MDRLASDPLGGCCEARIDPSHRNYIRYPICHISSQPSRNPNTTSCYTDAVSWSWGGRVQLCLKKSCKPHHSHHTLARSSSPCPSARSTAHSLWVYGMRMFAGRSLDPNTLPSAREGPSPDHDYCLRVDGCSWLAAAGSVPQRSLRCGIQPQPRLLRHGPPVIVVWEDPYTACELPYLPYRCICPPSALGKHALIQRPLRFAYLQRNFRPAAKDHS